MNSRSKGCRGEREAAAAIRDTLGVDARRGQQFAGGADSPDVICDLPGVHLEVKRTERLLLWKAVDQATADAGEKIPVVLHRANNRAWLAIVKLADLPQLAERIRDARYYAPRVDGVLGGQSECRPA